MYNFLILLHLQDMFDNMDKWAEKNQVMNDSGNFLIEVVTEPVAVEIKEQVLMLNRRWDDVGSEAKRFVAQETAEKGRRDYQNMVG